MKKLNKSVIAMIHLAPGLGGSVIDRARREMEILAKEGRSQ